MKILTCKVMVFEMPPWSKTMAAFLILFMAIKLVRMQLQVQADATDEETGESHEAPLHADSPTRPKNGHARAAVTTAEPRRSSTALTLV